MTIIHNVTGIPIMTMVTSKSVNSPAIVVTTFIGVIVGKFKVRYNFDLTPFNSYRAHCRCHIMCSHFPVDIQTQARPC